MDERSRALKRVWRDSARRAARDGFPLSPEVLRALFDELDRRLPEAGCDDSRRLTRQWLESHGHDVERVFAWLDEHGGHCDCEVLGNVEQHVEDALHFVG